MSLFTVFGGSKPRTGLTRQQQIDALRAANPYAAQAREDPTNSWDIGLKLPSGMVVRVRTTLPDGFPDVAPTVSIVERMTQHPWLDEQQRVVRSPDLASWSREKNLGSVVLSIIQHFGTNPPVFTPAPQPAPFQQARTGQYSGAPASRPGQLSTGGDPMGPIHAPAAAGVRGPLPVQTPIEVPGGASGARNNPGTPVGASDGLSSGMSQMTLARRDSLSREVSLAEITTARGHSAGGVGASSGASQLPHSQSHPALLHHSTSTHTMLPPVPSSFPALEAMSLDELNILLEDDSARTAFLANVDEFKVFESIAAGQREAAGSVAAQNISSAAQLKAAGEELKRAQEKTKAKQAELAALLAKQQAANERFSAPRLARELEVTASQLNTMTDELYEGFSSAMLTASVGGGAGMSFYGGSAGGSGGGDSTPGGGSVASSAASGGSGTGADPRLRKFSEEFIALRKRYHVARAKGYILSSVGVSEQP